MHKRSLAGWPEEITTRRVAAAVPAVATTIIHPQAGGRGNYRFKSSLGKTGLNKELEGNIFDLGECSSVDLMRTTQIKIAQYASAHYSGNIMVEL